MNTETRPLDMEKMQVIHSATLNVLGEKLKNLLGSVSFA